MTSALHLLAVALLLTAGPLHAMCTNPPVLVADQAQLVESTAVIDVLANDSDPDGEALEVQVLSGTCLALGTTQVLGGVVTYRASPGPLVPCSFNYRVTDESGLASDAVVSITIPPLVFSDSFESGTLSAWSIVVP